MAVMVAFDFAWDQGRGSRGSATEAREVTCRDKGSSCRTCGVALRG